VGVTESCDVIVVGAGLAGLECARRLGEAGLRTILVERKSAVTNAISTTGIFVRRTLEDFDLPASDLGPAIRDVAVYSPARRVLRFPSQHDEFRIGRMAPIYQHYLDRCRRAGVLILCGARFTGFRAGNQSSLAKLEHHGRPLSVTTKFLVGADGARSRVARRLGLDRNREFVGGYEEIWRGASIEGPPTLHCFLDPKLAPGYLAWVAHDGEETHIGVGGYLHRFNPVQALEEFRRSSPSGINLEHAQLIGRRGGLIPVGGVLPRIANRHGLLVGDAAGAPSPLTAGGLDACLRLSGHAARVIAAYLSVGDPAVLHAYSGARFRTRFVSRLWMRRLFSNARSAWALELGVALLRLPFLSSLARHVYFGRGSFPDVEAVPLPRPVLQFPR
jgi:flavin-dependent dehydrogenase